MQPIRCLGYRDPCGSLPQHTIPSPRNISEKPKTIPCHPKYWSPVWREGGVRSFNTLHRRLAVLNPRREIQLGALQFKRLPELSMPVEQCAVLHVIENDVSLYPDMFNSRGRVTRYVLRRFLTKRFGRVVDGSRRYPQLGRRT